jgi:hypothetical protein
MNYSRRQLYALGEPLGECVTRLKPGGRIYGGGDSPPAETTQTNVMELPDWAKGYAKDTLAKGAALTDISQNPYQQYGGERIAGFQPLQQRTFETAEQMQPSQQVGLGSSIAGMAGLGALGTNYQGGRFYGGQFNEQAAQDYMDPYAKNVVDYQKAQALRDFQIAQPMRQAQAVQQGAFGGSRSAIIDAEAQRSLNSQLQGIEATGRQAAFQNAQQQFERDQARRLQAQGMGEQSRQYGAGLGMQGLQTGLQAAGQLGQLGQTEYGQRMGITQLQSQLGAQQQQQAQRPLDMAYQDFINQQNYPYKQLGFMSDMIRGLPLGQQSTQSVYQAPPSTLQTLGALGMGAYGVNQMFGSPTPQARAADGGLTGYAVGGVTSDQNIESILDKLSDEQLVQAKEAALNRRDVEQAQMIDAEMAERASIRGGLGGAFNQIPVEQQEQMMAGGGIVAFETGGITDDKLREILAENAAEAGYDDTEGGTGNAKDRAFYGNESRRIYDELANEKLSSGMTEDQRRANTLANYKEVQAMAGPSPYEAQTARMADLEKQQAGNLQQQKGLAALAAIPAILQGGNAIRGLGGGAGAFAGAYGKAVQADRTEKLSLMSMKNNLEDAQYKLRVGLVGDARQLTAEARRDKQAADAAKIAKLKALGTLAAANERANRPVKAATRNFDIENREAIAEVLKDTNPMKQGETPEQYEKRLNAMAAREIYGAKGTKDITSTSTVSSNVMSDITGTKGDVEQQKADTSAKQVDEASLKDARAELAKLKKSRIPANQQKWKKMVDEYGSEEAAGEAYIKNYMVTPAAPAAAPAAKPAAPAAAPAQAGKVLTQADIAATAKASGKTIDEVKAQAKLKGYTIK